MIVLLYATSTCIANDLFQLHEDFTNDFRWEGANNRPSQSKCREIVQDFGYSATSHAGGRHGEIGGSVSRSFTMASYAKVIPQCGLDLPLRASGKLAVTRTSGGSGVLIGWFNSKSLGWRTANSLVFRIDGESGQFRIFFEYGTKTWKTGGGQTFDGQWQTSKSPLIPADGKSHTWVLEYDPNGAEGNGEIAFTLDDKKFRAVLGSSLVLNDRGEATSVRSTHKSDGASFDRFGILNQMITGGELEVWLDDIVIGTPETQTEDFTEKPSDWTGNGNRERVRDCAVRPNHDFMHRNSSRAGGGPGEIGGRIWRIESTHPEQALSYGTPIATGEDRLTLEDPLSASGEVCLEMGNADSAVLIGWYNSRTAIGAPPANFLGVLIEGPSRVGHYFRPVVCTSEHRASICPQGPILLPDGRGRKWSIQYNPSGKHVAVTLAGKKVDFKVDSALIKGNASFDRFGILSWHRGGHAVEVFFDDIEFTARRPLSSPESRKK